MRSTTKSFQALASQVSSPCNWVTGKGVPKPETDKCWSKIVSELLGDVLYLHAHRKAFDGEWIRGLIVGRPVRSRF